MSLLTSAPLQSTVHVSGGQKVWVWVWVPVQGSGLLKSPRSLAVLYWELRE